MGQPQAGGINRRSAARIVGGLALTGAVLCSAAYAVPGLLRPSDGWIWMASIQIVMVAVGIVVLNYRQLEHVLSAVILLGDLCWVAARWATSQPDSHAPIAYLCISAITAGLVFSRELLIVKMVLAFPIITLGLLTTAQGSTLLGAVISTGTSAALLSVLTYRTRRHMESRMDYVAQLGTVDPLTSLATRRHIQRKAPELLEYAVQRGHAVAAMVIDLDHFKRVNDEHGHSVGDQVLAAVAQQLRGTVVAGALLSRLGGEEFLVLTAATDENDARQQAQRLHESVTPMSLPVPVTCSVGVAVARLPDTSSRSVESLHTLITRADDAMYRAKRAGRDRVEVSLLAASQLESAPAPDTLSIAPETSPTTLHQVKATCPGTCELSRVNERVSQTVAASRMAGWLALLGAVSVGVNLLLTGVTYQGEPRWYLMSTGLYLLIQAWLLRWQPIRMARYLPFFVAMGPVLWVVVQHDELTTPLGQISPLLVVIMVVVAAWLLSAKATFVVVVAACFAFSAGMGDLRWSFSHLLGFVVISTIVCALLAVAVLWLRSQYDAAVKQAGQASVSDAVTGLANRRHLLEHAAVFSHRARNRKTAAVMVLDLDHFKKVNDTYGHAVGDEVLRHVGHALRASLGTLGVVARVGGEEMIVLAHVTGHEEARATAEKLRIAVATSLEPVGMHITCSVGVVSRKKVPSGNSDWLWEMYEHADQALYQAKSQGRNRVVMAQHEVVAPRRGGHIPLARPAAMPQV